VLLFEADRHEALAGAAWDPEHAREAICSIAQDLEQSLDPRGLSPPHPLDEEAGEARKYFKTLYLGAAGVLWALWYLERERAITLRVEPRKLIDAVDDAYLAEPDTDGVAPSYLMGEVGILLVRWRLTGSSAAADRLWTAIRNNVTNPTTDPFQGAAGTMLGALHMFAWTAERRWHELFDESVDRIWRTVFDEHELLGAAHGFAGTAYPLVHGAPLLAPARRAQLYDRCVATLRATAVRDGDRVNWPNGLTAPRPGRPTLLVQWCSGAPGIVTALADVPREVSPELDAMLIGAGATVWTAGPLAKGYGLCHGTAGNGYAFLELHHRTGDPIWLERARAFAMHALHQRDQMRRSYGRGRYSLWTGDAGLAVYLWQCLIGADGVPGLDFV